MPGVVGEWSAFEKFMEWVEAIPEGQLFASRGFNFIIDGTPAWWFTHYANHDGWGTNKIDKWRRARSKVALQQP
jgi:hypothetical protein